MLRLVATIPRAAARGLSVSSSAMAEAKPPSKQEVDDLFSDKKKQTRTHAFSKNSVEIIGGVGADPSLRTGKNNNSFTIINVLTNERVKLANGEIKETVENHPVFLFGAAAESAVKNIKRGMRVHVEGRLHYSGGNINVDGERVPRQTHIRARSVQPFARRIENDS